MSLQEFYRGGTLLSIYLPTIEPPMGSDDTHHDGYHLNTSLISLTSPFAKIE